MDQVLPGFYRWLLRVSPAFRARCRREWVMMGDYTLRTPAGFCTGNPWVVQKALEFPVEKDRLVEIRAWAGVTNRVTDAVGCLVQALAFEGQEADWTALISTRRVLGPGPVINAMVWVLGYAEALDMSSDETKREIPRRMRPFVDGISQESLALAQQSLDGCADTDKDALLALGARWRAEAGTPKVLLTVADRLQRAGYGTEAREYVEEARRVLAMFDGLGCQTEIIPLKLKRLLLQGAGAVRPVSSSPSVP
jgi:hypothetical protein